MFIKLQHKHFIALRALMEEVGVEEDGDPDERDALAVIRQVLVVMEAKRTADNEQQRQRLLQFQKEARVRGESNRNRPGLPGGYSEEPSMESA